MYKKIFLLLISFQAFNIYASAAQMPPLGKEMFAAVKGDDVNLSKVMAIAKSKGYSYSSKNPFNVGERVLVRRGDGKLTVGIITNKNDNGTYAIKTAAETAAGVPEKDELPQFIGKFPAKVKAQPEKVLAKAPMQVIKKPAAVEMRTRSRGVQKQSEAAVAARTPA